MQNNSEALSPCLFCGDTDPEITGEFGLHWIACTTGSECGACGPKCDSIPEAIRKWNRVAKAEDYKDARARYAPIRSTNWLRIYDALRAFNMPNMSDEDDQWSPYPLVDLLSADGDTIASGEEVMVGIADEIEHALTSSREPSHTNQSALHWTTISTLIKLARAAYHLADNSEEVDEETVLCLGAEWKELCDLLGALDELPDDRPGYVMGPAAKAEWALRGLLGSSAVKKSPSFFGIGPDATAGAKEG